MNIPVNYQAVMPYLSINNASGFIEFTKKVFDATEPYKVMRDENTIMHGEIVIRGSTIMFADATEIYNATPAGRSGSVKDPFGNTSWVTSVK